MSPEQMIEKVPYACGFDPISANKTGEWRFMTPDRVSRLSPCRQGCPLDGHIPGWLEAVKAEKWDEAWEIMSIYNPFPAITGHVCFHPCTENCNRGQLDEVIDIPGVERTIGEWRLANYQKPETPQTDKGDIAVVGSGPAGLSSAYYLAQAGYGVTVFERSGEIGGMLALGIPEYRLPRKVLQKEIAVLEKEGIKFVTSCNIGKDKSVADLFSEFDQVFFATGAWIPRKANIPGEKNSGVFNALDFLSRVNTGNPPELTESVVVIGGGNAAVDSARTALRMNGVNHVSLIYRRSRVEMPADPVEVEAAEREGVELIFNARPREIITEKNEPTAVIFDHSKTNLEGLVVDSSRSFTKECGSVIMALGQEADHSLFGEINEERSVFAGGDLVTGPDTVPAAIRAGRIAALCIQSAMEDLPLPELELEFEKALAFEDLNLEAQVNLEFQQRQAEPVSEAARCLGCGTCTSCGICYLFCPDLAVDLVDGRYEFNLDYCKGCGICVKECPSQALAMKGGR
ncbi:MAG: FAD-dependent oxidoreductase [Bacillota bacterium]|nr:FAD-dependent oxidoreductase [Bacillota bacterium]